MHTFPREQTTNRHFISDSANLRPMQLLIPAVTINYCPTCLDKNSRMSSLRMTREESPTGPDWTVLHPLPSCLYRNYLLTVTAAPVFPWGFSSFACRTIITTIVRTFQIIEAQTRWHISQDFSAEVIQILQWFYLLICWAMVQVHGLYFFKRSWISGWIDNR